MSLLLLIVAFLTTGFVAISNKALVAWGLGAYRDVYLLALYGTPLVIGLVLMLIRREKSRATDRWVGGIMGILGVTSIMAFLITLEHLPAVVAFPVRNVGTTIMTCLISMVAWQEKLSRGQWVAVALSIAAIWMIC